VPHLPWEPAPDELEPAEVALLARLSPVGLDGLTPRAALAARHGVGSYHGWRDVIALPPTSALGLPTSFLVGAEPEVADLVPEHAWADHLPVPDARENFATALAALSAGLGPGERTDVSNTLGARWKAGVFRVDLVAFPPELQRTAANSLHERCPALVHRATVSFGAPGAFAVPDGSLRRAAALLGAGRGEQVGPGVAPTWGEGRWPRRHGRRNPVALVAAVGEGCFAWRDAVRAGVSDRWASLVLPADPAARVVVVHGTEERSANARSEVEWVGAGARVTVFTAREQTPAEAAARALADAWDLPCFGEDTEG
jgi:hypothetical protein